MHPGMMQAPYQLMPMMPNQMAPNYDAPETDEFTPQQPGSFTSDESEALAKLLAADTAQVAQRGDGEDGSKDRDEDNAGASGATQADDPSGGARNGAKSSDQRHPRLERQVFVGGLPVDVTSTLFRTWADQVFPGRVINAVLVSA